MSLVVFTALVGLLSRPAICTRLCCGHRADLHRGRRRRRRRAQHVVRRRHRRAAWRARGRPVPAGRVAPGEALAFGLTLAGFSVVVLGLLVNVRRRRAAGVNDRLLCVDLHDVAEAPTPQNIVIGGAAGALPPMIGWAAVTGGVAHRAGRCSSSSSSSGRRRISGRCRCIAPRIMPARACRCCRWFPASRQRGGRSCSIRSCCAARRAPWLLGYAGALYGIVARRRRRRHRGAGVAHSRASASGHAAQQADVRLLDPLSVPAVCHAAGRPGPAGLFGRFAA